MSHWLIQITIKYKSIKITIQCLNGSSDDKLEWNNVPDGDVNNVWLPRRPMIQKRNQKIKTMMTKSNRTRSLTCTTNLSLSAPNHFIWQQKRPCASNTNECYCHWKMKLRTACLPGLRRLPFRGTTAKQNQASATDASASLSVLNT